MELALEPEDAPSFLQKNAGFSAQLEPFLSCPLRPASTSWLEIQVFYVRVSCPYLEHAPDLLGIKCSARASNCLFEVNRSRVSLAQEATLSLRRDRMDAETAEAIYVCTDSLRTTGPLAFKICEQDDATLICGIIKKCDSWPDGPWVEGVGPLCKSGWLMECNCTVPSSGCAFLKGKGDLSMLPSIEVCIAGRFCSSPVILTQTVPLVARRRHSRRHTLDAIPEADEFERTKESSDLAKLSNQMKEHTIYQELDLITARPLGMYEPCVSLEDDYGDLTWFNTGVRVGVGIGLGMCVGLGIGVGLLMRGYQATTRVLKRKLL